MTKEQKARKKEYDRVRYLKNKDYINKITKEYKKSHPEASRRYSRMYYYRNRERILAKKHEKDVTEEQRRKNRKYYHNNRISRVMAQRIRSSLKSKDGKSWADLVDYTIEELKAHLESKFKDEMTWNNYGKWHIDHIKPISKFNVTSFDCYDFKECWSLNNLQPLWAVDNLRKHNKWSKL